MSQDTAVLRPACQVKNTLKISCTFVPIRAFACFFVHSRALGRRPLALPPFCQHLPFQSCKTPRPFANTLKHSCKVSRSRGPARGTLRATAGRRPPNPPLNPGQAQPLAPCVHAVHVVHALHQVHRPSRPETPKR